MAYLDVYELLVKLPYPVYDKKGTAKFDKIKKTLVLTLPVKPSEIVMNNPTPGDDNEAKPGGNICNFMLIYYLVIEYTSSRRGGK